jgi:hypothetical protein
VVTWHRWRFCCCAAPQATASAVRHDEELPCCRPQYLQAPRTKGDHNQEEIPQKEEEGESLFPRPRGSEERERSRRRGGDVLCVHGGGGRSWRGDRSMERRKEREGAADLCRLRPSPAQPRQRNRAASDDVWVHAKGSLLRRAHLSVTHRSASGSSAAESMQSWSMVSLAGSDRAEGTCAQQQDRKRGAGDER